MVDAAFIVFCAAIGAARYLVLVRNGVPAGVDNGNWLAFGHAIFGENLRSSEIVYPPTVPLLLTGAVGVLGAVPGVAALSAVASLAPAAAVYALLRHLRLGWVAAILAALLAPAASTGEATAWGGQPQLLGIAGGLVFIWLLDRALRSGSRRRAFTAGLVLCAVAATSHLVLAATVASGIAVVVCHVVFNREEQVGLRRLPLLLGVVIVPALPLVPLYVHLLSSIGRNATVDAVVPQGRLGDLPSELAVLWPEFAVLWIALFAAALVIPLLVLDQRRSPPWVVATCALVGPLALVLMTREWRFLYLLPAAVLLGVGLWIWDVGRLKDVFFDRARAGAAALLAVGLLAQTVTGMAEFPDQAKRYRLLDRDLVAGIDWLRKSTTADSLVAVSPLRNAPLGWWVEGLGRRRALVASPLRWLNFEDERRRARLANRIFGQSFPSTEGMELAAAQNVTHLLVATRWEWFSGEGLREVRQSDPGLVLFENQSVVILRVRQA